jgi:hypothetical protein
MAPRAGSSALLGFAATQNHRHGVFTIRASHAVLARLDASAGLLRVTPATGRNPNTRDERMPATDDMSYAHEKFSSAVHEMAVSELPIRERVRNAHTAFIAVCEDDLPADARVDFVALMARMTWAEDKTGEGTVAATLRLVSDGEARSLARLICDIDTRIEHAMFGGERQAGRLEGKRERARTRKAA